MQHNDLTGLLSKAKAQMASGQGSHWLIESPKQEHQSRRGTGNHLKKVNRTPKRNAPTNHRKRGTNSENQDLCRVHPPVVVVFLTDLASDGLRPGAQREPEERSVVRLLVGVRPKVAAEHVVVRLELVTESTQLPLVLLHIDPDPRLRLVLDAAAEVRRMRVEDHDAVSTDEARYVRQIVHGVEPEPEATDLVRLHRLRGAVQLRDVLEVGVREHGVVVGPQRRALALGHAVVNEARARVVVTALVVQDLDDGGASVVGVLHELLGYREAVRVFLEEGVEAVGEGVALAETEDTTTVTISESHGYFGDSIT